MGKLEAMKAAIRQAQTAAPPVKPPAAKGKPGKGKGVYKPRPADRDKEKAKKGRLPDGAEFRIRYDATTQTWSGSLCVDIRDGEDSVQFDGRMPGAFLLLDALDTQYRQWLKRAAGEPGKSKDSAVSPTPDSV